MSNQMFNDEFMPNLQEQIQEYIKTQFDKKIINIKITRDLDEEKDSDKIDNLVEFLFNADLNFADYFTGHYCYEPDMLLEMIIYCNEWLDNNLGEDQVIDWKRYRDYKYIINLTAYIYIKEHREEFIALINENKNDFVINYLK